jgi:putative FmdB family regulatory protein
MPSFKYICKECGHSYKDLAKHDELIKCPKCGHENTPSLPSEMSSAVMQTLDPNRGKQVRKGVSAELKDRMNRHHDRYEVAEKIDKHGIKDAVRNGWVNKAKKV